MKKFNHNDLWSLEEYAKQRDVFKSKVMAHKKVRRLPIGPNAAVYFEDRLTIQYQMQEMLRIEHISESVAIAEELSTYNPLVPDGANWKATFMIEFGDEAERRVALQRMTNIERAVWMRIGDHERVVPFVDEDMERTNDVKTSAVHFLRFELTEDMILDLKAGVGLSAGINHPEYVHVVAKVAEEIRLSLLQDLD